MMKQITPWLKGVLAPVLVMVIFAIPVGVFMALALLVFAMEEGGETMSSFAVPLTRVIVLLSQGVGMHAGAITLTIVPLLLTLAMILLIRAVYSRWSTDLPAYLAGVVTWIVLCLWCSGETRIQLTDSTWLIALKCAVVFSLGFAWRAFPGSALLDKGRLYCREHISQPVRSSIHVGVRLALRLLVMFLSIGLITVLVWICLNHSGMVAMFKRMHMNTGSCILMCIMALAWLPNMALWALSWVFGGGFHIGQAASYSLWSAQIHELPSLPIFALFPHPVDNADIRTCLMLIPVMLGFVFGLLTLLLHRGFHVRGIDPNEPVDVRDLLLRFAYPAGAFCITATLVSLMSSLAFWLANGSLGVGRLRDVGVDVMRSTNVVARPCAIGLGLSWISAIVIVAIHSLMLMMLKRRAANRTSLPLESADSPDDERKEHKTPHTPRVVNSTFTQKETKGDD